MVGYMDRRQRKTRELIFNAFIQLLSKKHYNNVTVGEIIELANVGRATFYAHFETKDFLLKELCVELFDHIFNAEHKSELSVGGIFNCDIQGSVFLHLFKHVKENDINIRKLLSSQNNELFLEYFKSEVKNLVVKRLEYFDSKKPKNIPNDFWVNHVASTFIETLKWWINNKMKESVEVINEYFMALV